MRKYVNSKVYRVLMLLGIVSVLCVIPYILTIQNEVFKQIPIPLPVILFAQIVQTSILFAITIFLGLFFAKKINLETPVLDAMVGGKKYTRLLQRSAASAIPWGVVTAISIYASDSIFGQLGATITTHQTTIPAWRTLLAAVYGGITEEIIMRLFLMTCIAWLMMKLTNKERPTTTQMWLSIVLAAVIFGLGHLPVTATLTAITPLVIARAIVLNGIGGVIFGWLFWKKGLESAMIAHWTADIFLLTILPRLV